jgi:hypothetical protein
MAIFKKILNYKISGLLLSYNGEFQDNNHISFLSFKIGT